MSQITILPTGPANHNTIVASGSWSTPIAYSDTGTRLTYDVSADDRVPDDATAVLLRIKLKAYVPNGSGYGYAQANVRMVNPGEVMNHLMHVDEWGRGAGNSGEGRRIPYASVFAPIIGGEVQFDVAREIIGRGQIECVIYLEGYLTP